MAVLSDLDEVKALADANRAQLGFVTRGTLTAAMESGEILVATYEGKVIAFQHYHHRKRDNQTTLYRKAVAQQWRRRGLGRRLVDAVAKEALALGKSSLFLKCPFDNEANEFHVAIGFRLVGHEKGSRRSLNLYRYELGTT